MAVSDLSLPDPPARLHFVGIGGIGVSGLARILRARGYEVSGSDMVASDVTDRLREEGIQVDIGHAAKHVDDAEFVIMTAAANSKNVELVAAYERGIPVVKRAAILGLLARDFKTLAVAGTHGKSTTSGMAAVALDVAGHAPGFAVGAIVPPFATNARDSGGEFFVVEADEYDYSFLQLRPNVGIITNIEHDHPDLFPDFEAVLSAFEEFVERIRPRGTLVISADDPGCRALFARSTIRDDISVVTFGEDSGDWKMAGNGTISGPHGQMFELRLAVPGRHNRLNALAVLAASEALQVATEEMVAGLEQFSGVGRRFEILREDERLAVVSDYAHHPTEVHATIRAARERFPVRRIIVLFQPHTFSRTSALVDEFAKALSEADSVVLAAVYAARETDDLGVSSASIAERVHIPVHLAGDWSEAANSTAAVLEAGDVLLVLGAGDIVKAAEELAGKRE